MFFFAALVIVLVGVLDVLEGFSKVWALRVAPVSHRLAFDFSFALLLRGLERALCPAAGNCRAGAGLGFRA